MPFFFRHNQTPTATQATRAATPLMVPPTMAPVCFFFSLSPSSVSGAAAPSVEVAASSLALVFDAVSVDVSVDVFVDVSDDDFVVAVSVSVDEVSEAVVEVPTEDVSDADSEDSFVPSVVGSLKLDTVAVNSMLKLVI